MNAETDTLKAAIQRLEIAQQNKLTHLLEIKEGFATIADLLYDGSGECASDHNLTERQEVGLIFAAQAMAYCMGSLIEDLDHIIDGVLKEAPSG